MNKTLTQFEQDASNSPNIDDVKIDTRLSVLKPLHAKVISKAHEHFKTESGKRNVINGWRASGIKKDVEDCRENSVESIFDPFKNMRI